MCNCSCLSVKSPIFKLNVLLLQQQAWADMVLTRGRGPCLQGARMAQLARVSTSALSAVEVSILQRLDWQPYHGWAGFHAC